MDLAFRNEMIELMETSRPPCVSVFLPTHRAGKEREQDPIRLENLLRQAEKQLVEAHGMRSPNAKELLRPAWDLARDSSFNRHLADGLAIFIATGLFRTYRLPIHFQELAAVGGRFHLKPLIPMLGLAHKFYILAASQNLIRIFLCTGQGVSELHLEGVPHGMREALGYDDTEARLLFRSVAPAATARGMPAFHGHGGGIETDKTDLAHYFKKVDEALSGRLGGGKAPLVFAGVEFLFPIFREVSTHPNLLGEFIAGNPDGTSAEGLGREGLRIAGPYFRKDRGQALARYGHLLGAGLASDSLEAILPAAFAGRIDTLFLDPGVQVRGTFDPASGAIEVHDEKKTASEDLIDLAACRTLAAGGVLHALEPDTMPGATGAAAIFRY